MLYELGILKGIDIRENEKCVILSFCVKQYNEFNVKLSLFLMQMLIEAFYTIKLISEV